MSFSLWQHKMHLILFENNFEVLKTLLVWLEEIWSCSANSLNKHKQTLQLKAAALLPGAHSYFYVTTSIVLTVVHNNYPNPGPAAKQLTWKDRSFQMDQLCFITWMYKLSNVQMGFKCTNVSSVQMGGQYRADNKWKEDVRARLTLQS